MALTKKPIPSNQLDTELKQFTPYQRSLIYENVFAIELTEGCSIGCDFCGADSVKGVKDIIPYPTLEQIAKEMAEFTNRTTHADNRDQSQNYPPDFLTLYNATEPLDYESEGKNYFDAARLFSGRCFSVRTITAIPAGKEELAAANLSAIDRISISHINRSRLEPHFDKLGIAVYIDLFNYYVFKGKVKATEPNPEKYAVKVKASVEETLEGLIKKGHTLPDKARFYDIGIDGNKPRYKVQADDNLFLFCGSANDNDRIRDKDYEGVLNSGRAFSMEHNEATLFSSFRNIYGVKITPKGIFNVVAVNPSNGNKTGVLMEKITPAHFKVVELDNSPYIQESDRIERHYVLP